jgi:hypothetical protein
MKRIAVVVLVAGLVIFLATRVSRARGRQSSPAPSVYLGFDRNDYPGDESMKALRRTFSYTGYWLNNPPGASSNSWVGKHSTVQAMGYGFLVLFNGRVYRDIMAHGDPAKLGGADGKAAADSARREGFPAKTILFLDQEEGGRMLPEQRAYIHAWADAVQAAGYRAGVYCSGMGSSEEESGETIITADDIRHNAEGRQLTYWVTNDSCPPSPGCTFPANPPKPAASGVSYADVWQFAQSPRRTDYTKSCAPNYNPDGNCYPAGGEAQNLHVDVNTATSADPSHGRTR